jgi:chorismate-pyruvate lyase
VIFRLKGVGARLVVAASLAALVPATHAQDAPPWPDTFVSRLEITGRDEVRYRKVHLRCGARVLSNAENWYVPGRLTPDMNRLLETTDTPFGKVVESLQPYRRTFAVRLLWAPLAAGWERESGSLPAATGGSLAIPDALFEHRAVLYTRGHKPFAEVRELYQRQLLAFPPRSPH